MDLSGIRESLPGIENPFKKVCAVCQAPADKSCGACCQIDYCSAEHQKSHWKKHKKVCSPIRIVDSPELGPHFVVTRDLPPGTLLLTELPVLALPGPCADNHDPSCLSCRSILPSIPVEGKIWTCSKCSTPLFCNHACSLNKVHSEFECGVLSKCIAKQRAKLYDPLILCHLRAIDLKNRDPKTWTKVLELRGSDQYKPEDADEKDKWFIEKILPHLGKQAKGYEAEMFKFKGILQQNEIVEHQNGVSIMCHGESRILYLKASNFAQGCFPNCTPIIGKGPQFQLKVQSTVEIKKGQILSIDYLRISSSMGAMARQHNAIDIGRTLCICPRCIDPSGTELGTMFSAVKCTEPECQDGYLLPVDPMDMGKNAPWRCNRSGCNGKGSTWEEIDGFIKKLVDDMKAFLPSVPLKDVFRTFKFLNSLKKKLHPNHWLVIQFQNDRVKQLFFEATTPDPLPVPQLCLNLSMIDDILRMAEFTAPGLSFTRACLWKNQHTLLLRQLFMPGGEFLSEGFENEFKRSAVKAIDQFCSIAKFYPDTWPVEDLEEIKMARTALHPRR